MRIPLDRVVTLFRKDLCGDLSTQEREELKRLLKEEKLKRVYNSMLQKGFIGDRLSEYEQFSDREAFRKFTARTGKRRNKVMYLSAVAAMVLVVLGFAFLWERERNVLPSDSLADNELIAPGARKAILRLADGRMIHVMGDSLQIQEKAGATIEYSQGSIVYKMTGQVEELMYNELIVPLGGECYVTLEDGSKIWVNSGSRLRYPVKFIEKERKVFLEGEAYFEVVKNSKPFIVHTALGKVNVLGTHFGVKAYEEDQKVYTTLVSGKVSFAGNEVIEIVPGEQVIAYASGEMKKRSVDVEEFVGWKEGVYVFKNQSLEMIMNDLSRWYDVEVFFQHPALKQIEFTGNLKRYDNINIFMELLQRTGDVRYRISGKTIIIYK